MSGEVGNVCCMVDNDEREVILGLWSLPGVGARTLEVLRRNAGSSLSPLLDLPCSQWLPQLRDDLPAAGLRALSQADGWSPRELAQRVLAQASAGDMEVCFPGDPAWPRGLTDCWDAPPLLFFRGKPTPPVPRLAMVGCRRPDGGYEYRAHTFAREVALAGIGVVSGGAMGVDQACHHGARVVGQQTWVFLGSALDHMDSAQLRLQEQLLKGPAVIYSELPPGVPASPITFPRRNRLISGASDAVLVLRAGKGSGSLHTALAAIKQGRPLWAIPGELYQENAQGCLSLLGMGVARICVSSQQVISELKGCRAEPPEARNPTRRTMTGLSEEARLAYQALQPGGNSFEEVLCSMGLPAAVLTSALCELELGGWVVSLPGRVFEKAVTGD